MNENEICNILTRIQEIEKLQKELRNLLPHVTNNNRINVDKPVEVSNLKKESSSTIRFPSLLTFPVTTEQSSFRKHDRIQGPKEIRSSMMNMKNIQMKESLKNVPSNKRASLNITINDSTGKFYRNINKDLPNVLENSVKTQPRNLQSFHSRSMLNNNKKISHIPTISERIVNNIPKIRDPKKLDKHKTNDSKLLNPVNEKRKNQIEDKSYEYKRKSNLSSAMEFTIHSCPQTSDVQMEKLKDNQGIFVCQEIQTEEEKRNDILIKEKTSKFEILEKILKRLDYCILDDRCVSSISHSSNDKTRYTIFRKPERLSFITNEGQETDEILSSINEVNIYTNIPANNVRLDSNFGNNVAAICKIMKKFDGIDKVSKIFKMSWKEKSLSDGLSTLRHTNRSIKIRDNLNNPSYCNRNSRSNSLETITTKSPREKKYPLKFLRKICFCMNP